MTEQTYLLAETIHARRFVDDDAASFSVKRMLQRANVTMALWYCTFISVMLREIYQFNIGMALLFLPMWVGSFVLIVSSIEMFFILCRSNHLITHEQRAYAGSSNITTSSNFIEYESLPLLRSLYLYGVLGIICMVLCLATQILLYLFFVHRSIAIWDALSPLIAMNICFIVYLLLVKTMSALFCVWYIYFVLSMVYCPNSFFLSYNICQIIILVRLEHTDWCSWLDALMPLASLQIAFLCMFLYLLLSYHRYHLSLSQVLCVIGYCTSIILMLYNEYTIGKEDSSLYDQVCIIWLVAITLFILSLMGTINHNVLLFAEKRGYYSPQQLIKTHQGWRTLYPRERKYWPMIGYIELRQSFILRNLDLADSQMNV